ncbi:MAG: helix-turn-helix domain-containing protein [Acidobacteriota bacterium]
MATSKKNKLIRKSNLIGSENIDLSSIKSDMGDARTKLINCYLLRNCTSKNTPLNIFINALEKEVIKKTLKISRGNQKTASLILGIKASTLNEKIKRFEILEPRENKVQIELFHLLKNRGRSNQPNPKTKY